MGMCITIGRSLGGGGHSTGCKNGFEVVCTGLQPGLQAKKVAPILACERSMLTEVGSAPNWVRRRPTSSDALAPAGTAAGATPAAGMVAAGMATAPAAGTAAGATAAVGTAAVAVAGMTAAVAGATPAGAGRAPAVAPGSAGAATGAAGAGSRVIPDLPAVGIIGAVGKGAAVGYAGAAPSAPPAGATPRPAGGAATPLGANSVAGAARLAALGIIAPLLLPVEKPPPLLTCCAAMLVAALVAMPGCPAVIMFIWMLTASWVAQLLSQESPLGQLPGWGACTILSTAAAGRGKVACARQGVGSAAGGAWCAGCCAGAQMHVLGA